MVILHNRVRVCPKMPPLAIPTTLSGTFERLVGGPAEVPLVENSAYVGQSWFAPEITCTKMAREAQPRRIGRG